jgi:hypothetical protein
VRKRRQGGYRKGGFNYCHWCRKFRRWDDLRAAYEFNAGSYEPKEILECKPGTGCNPSERLFQP